MKTYCFCVWLSVVVLSAFSARAVTNPAVRVFMPDGQIVSHLLRVYITEDITEADAPTLTLMAGKFVLDEVPTWAERANAYRELARFQPWAENVDGTQVQRTGTLLVFDLRKAGFPFFKACMRITPVVKWGQPTRTAVGARAVYLGNLKGAALWTLVVVGASVAMIFVFTRYDAKGDSVRKGNFKWLLLNPDGKLSLSKTQVGIWTVCVGAMVFAFGLIRLEPPEIPETLVALIGLSLATRVVTYTQEEKTKVQGDPHLSDLIRAKVDGSYELSIAKAQMLFWTCLVASLFVVKSSIDGELWNVPWQLVTLMGISQASYLAPVVYGQNAQKPEEQKKPKEGGSPPI